MCNQMDGSGLLNSARRHSHFLNLILNIGPQYQEGKKTLVTCSIGCSLIFDKRLKAHTHYDDLKKAD